MRTYIRRTSAICLQKDRRVLALRKGRHCTWTANPASSAGTERRAERRGGGQAAQNPSIGAGKAGASSGADSLEELKWKIRGRTVLLGIDFPSGVCVCRLLCLADGMIPKAMSEPVPVADFREAAYPQVLLNSLPSLYRTAVLPPVPAHVASSCILRAFLVARTANRAIRDDTARVPGLSADTRPGRIRRPAGGLCR